MKMSHSNHLAARAPGQMLLAQPLLAARPGCLRLPRPAKLPTRGLGTRTLRHPQVICSQSSRDEPEVSAGISFAKLPVSQQSLSMAFQILDKDEDGRISRSESCRLVAYYLALQHHKPPPAQRRALTWDQHLLSSINTAHKLSGGSLTGVASACEAYVGAKVSGGLQAHPPRCSDLVWGAAGMAAAVLVLGVLAAAAKDLPMVGHWHQQGVPLLLGSFGTLAILLFGKPEAEPVRLWPIIAGQVGAAAIVMTVLQVWGANLVSRAAAMAATVAWMMWSDCIHPPGGALVLMAMDNTAIQRMSWAYVLWPSLAISLSVLLPISAFVNYLRRNYQFDTPWSAPGAASLQQKILTFQQQQAAKQAAMLRHWKVLELDRGSGGQQALHLELHSPLARLARALSPILQLLRFPKPAPKLPQQRQQPRRWGVITAGGQQLQVRGVNLDMGGLDLGRSVSDAGTAERAAAAALEDAIRRRLRQEQNRKLEDNLHSKRIWGGPAQTPDPNSLDKQPGDIGQQDKGAQSVPHPQQQLPMDWQPPQQSQQQGQAGAGHQQQQHDQEQLGAGDMISPRQRLEQYWDFRARLSSDLSSSSSGSSGLEYRSSSPTQLQERQQEGEDGGKRSTGPLDSFAPDD